jgi:hypothetical protein
MVSHTFKEPAIPDHSMAGRPNMATAEDGCAQSQIIQYLRTFGQKALKSQLARIIVRRGGQIWPRRRMDAHRARRCNICGIS